MTDVRTFVDTNVLVYSMDVSVPEKRARALEVLGELTGLPPTISTQVLQEFYVVVRRLAVPMSEKAAEREVERLSRLPVVRPDPAMILAAIRLTRRLKLSFWDARIVQAALESGCTRLLTEDLQHGQLIDGRLRVENPFLVSGSSRA